jgi:hypothetical protein
MQVLVAQAQEQALALKLMNYISNIKIRKIIQITL